MNDLGPPYSRNIRYLSVTTMKPSTEAALPRTPYPSETDHDAVNKPMIKSSIYASMASQSISEEYEDALEEDETNQEMKAKECADKD
ncbi:MAG: hypothetical protein M1822_009068 [Bathelium mastoideum]|nr:MAG: hypothetical protein M1822_009068 [Bathelium mastoideum]